MSDGIWKIHLSCLHVLHPSSLTKMNSRLESDWTLQTLNLDCTGWLLSERIARFAHAQNLLRHSGVDGWGSLSRSIGDSK